MTHYKGNYSKYLELKAEQLASEWKAYEKQQEEINKLEDFVAKNLVRASTTKRAQSRRKVFYKSKMPPLVTTQNIFYPNLFTWIFVAKKPLP